MASVPQSLSDARARGERFYFTGKPCKRGHVAKRYVSTASCSACEIERCLRYYHADPESAKKQRRWRDANRGAHNAHQGKRYASKVKATPKWLSEGQLAEIKVFYDEAARLTLKTGVKHQVDHVIPLLNDRVCGLHVPWNLQVLTKSQNQAKGNRFDDGDYQ